MGAGARDRTPELPIGRRPLYLCRYNVLIFPVALVLKHIAKRTTVENKPAAYSNTNGHCPYINETNHNVSMLFKELFHFITTCVSQFLQLFLSVMVTLYSSKYLLRSVNTAPLPKWNPNGKKKRSVRLNHFGSTTKWVQPKCRQNSSLHTRNLCARTTTILQLVKVELESWSVNCDR